MKKLLLTILAEYFVFVAAVIAGEVTNHFYSVVTDKTQNIEMKEDGYATYTIRYVSSNSQRTDSQSYTFDEPKEGSISGLQYRGGRDRTYILPDDFASVGDIICKTNINGKVYLYATTKQAEPTASVLERLKKKREEQ